MPYVGAGGGSPPQEERNGSGETFLYVDAAGGSTYTEIQDAVDDAGPHTTILVNPGSYPDFTVEGKSDLTIRGNTSSPDDVSVSPTGMLPTGPGATLRSGSNITLSSMKIHGGYNSVSTVVSQCNNITLMNLKLYSVLTNALSISSSEDVSLAFITSYETISIHSSTRVDGGFLSITSQGVGFAVYSSTEVYMDWMSLSINESAVLYCAGSDNITLRRVSGTYHGLFAELHGSRARVIGYDPPPSDLAIDSDSVFTVENYKLVIVRDETNTTALEGVDLKLTSQGEVRYSTEHYGGTDPLSDGTGRFLQLPPFVAKAYLGTNSSTPSINRLSAWYGEVGSEVTLENIDGSTTSSIFILMDTEVPWPPRNVTGEPVSENAVRISFDESNSTDVVGYRIYSNSTGEWREILNTSTAGEYIIDNLTENTTYSFKVVAFDDAGLESEGVMVNVTTLPRTKGTLSGEVTYSGGPMDGSAAEGASVSLYNSSMALVGSTTTGSDGNFTFENVTFEELYTLKVEPPDAVTPGGNTSGYTSREMRVNFTEDEHFTLTIPYYEYIPPTEGTLSGWVIYSGGPLTGETVPNATVEIYSGESLMAAAVSGSEGEYSVENLTFGLYTVVVTPEGAVVEGGNESGYVVGEIELNFTGDTFKNFTVNYYEYTPSTEGTLSGWVIYSGGPLAGETVPNATVEIYSGESLVAAAVSGSEGEYSVDNLTFGLYRVVVTPEGAVVEGGNESGYVRVEIELNFTVDTLENLTVNYYEYTPPAPPQHPRVRIVDAEGEPVEGVTVKASVNGTLYTAVTDDSGWVVFEGFDGEEFPPGTEFTAEKEGYEKVSWMEGETPPPLKEEKESKEFPLIYLLLIAVVVILLLILLLYLFSRGKKAVIEE